MNNAELIKRRAINILKSKSTNVQNLTKLLRADLKKLFANYLIFEEDDLEINIDENYKISITLSTQKVLDFGKFIE